MSEPIGSNAPVAPLHDDLSLIYQGGANFMERMQALDKRRMAHDEAFLRLKVGNDAKAAFEDATEKQKAARAALAEAEQTLQKAKADAAALISAANTDAEAIRNAAEASAKNVTDTAGKVKIEADKYAVQKKAEADRSMTTVEQVRYAVTKTNAEAKSLADQHRTKIAEAEKSTQVAAQKDAKLTAKLVRLQSVLDELRKD